MKTYESINLIGKGKYMIKVVNSESITYKVSLRLKDKNSIIN